MAKNFLLWIDAVGGFWVCTGETVTIGQPDEGCESSPDVPILGDLLHRHARIRRDGECYLIEAIRDVRVDGRSIPRVDAGAKPLAALADGCRIELGPSVRLRFRRPHALTGTARLEFASHHHTQPTVSAVILMADTCILGPRPHSHIVCRHWTEEVILFKHDNELFCRTKGPMQIDGVKIRDRGRLQYDSQVTGECFSFNLEPL
ncbi:MAG: hypothetical protein IT426_05015 [Pirellulales bacterium]|nr:hypothetical protein [Pirellulales bacterium]